MSDNVCYCRVTELRGSPHNGWMLRPHITKTERMTLRYRKTHDAHGLCVVLYSPFPDVLTEDCVFECHAALLYYHARKSKQTYIWTKDYLR
jgi:tricorn protease-like protein